MKDVIKNASNCRLVTILIMEFIAFILVLIYV
jgi:hypothetical protein